MYGVSSILVVSLVLESPCYRLGWTYPHGTGWTTGVGGGVDWSRTSRDYGHDNTPGGTCGTESLVGYTRTRKRNEGK